MVKASMFIRASHFTESMFQVLATTVKLQQQRKADTRSRRREAGGENVTSPDRRSGPSSFRRPQGQRRGVNHDLPNQSA